MKTITFSDKIMKKKADVKDSSQRKKAKPLQPHLVDMCNQIAETVI
jgi:hypothetical protein